MATKPKALPVAQSVNVEPKSIQDLGYAVSGTVTTLENQAKWAIVNISGIVDGKVSEEDRAEYDKGVMMRYAQSNPDQRYIVTGENLYIPATVDAMQDINPSHTIAVLNIYTCMALSQQAFGKLKSESPSLHSIYGVMRDDWSNYRGKAWAALTKKVKELTSGKDKRVAQGLDFEVRVNKIFEEQLDKGVKAANKRGDITANENRYLASKAAFWKTWNEYNV
jgi:hypothetical protein